MREIEEKSISKTASRLDLSACKKRSIKKLPISQELWCPVLPHPIQGGILGYSLQCALFAIDKQISIEAMNRIQLVDRGYE